MYKTPLTRFSSAAARRAVFRSPHCLQTQPCAVTQGQSILLLTVPGSDPTTSHRQRQPTSIGLHLRIPSLMDYYSFSRHRRDGWLSWPCRLTDSGRSTHNVVTRPAVSIAQDRESPYLIHRYIWQGDWLGLHHIILLLTHHQSKEIGIKGPY